MYDFNDIFNKISGTDFEEIPVTIEEFVTSSEYLNMGMTPLSEYQYALIKASSQIYKEETLIALYGEEEGKRKFKNETKREVIAALGKGCHAPYTPIFNPETGKWMRLDEATGDGMALSDDGKTHYATEAFVEGYGKMFRVKTSLGFEEDVYVGHKYLSFTKSKFYHRKERGHSASYQRVDELSVGDRIAVALNFDVDVPKNIPVEHAELIGYWIGDGCMPTDENQMLNMDFCRDEEESIRRYLELCESIGDTPTRIEHPTKNMTIFRHGKNSNAVSLAKKYGLWGSRAKDKRIPDEVWASDNSIISATLSKLWQTDGCVYAKNGLTAEFVTVSPGLGDDVQKMLLRVGVPSTVRRRTPKSNFENASEATYVTVTSQECMLAFASSVTLLDHKKFSLDSKSGRVYSRIDGDRYYDRIVSIEELPDAEYWTRTVPDTGNYVGNGMISAQSGKDFTSTIACAYIVYLLLCLRDPAIYYNKPAGDSIDILNIAVNAAQANNVFFKNFKKRIKESPWFEGKFDDGKSGEIAFDKDITVYSGHSEREAFEGYNTFYVVLDEISAFAMTSSSGNVNSKTAGAIYDMYRASVTSRFPEFGKLVLLSFPRHKNDFITTRYNEAVVDKEVVMREHTFKIHNDLPDGTIGNEFTIQWEEDHIIAYKLDNIWALRRPSWEVNPTRSLEDYKADFYENEEQALARFACMPPEAESGFFRDHAKIDQALSSINAVIASKGLFIPGFRPNPKHKYYVHVDLAQKVDRCAVAVAHVDGWTSTMINDQISDPSPKVVVDVLRYWTPDKKNNKTVDFGEVRKFLAELPRLGFNVGLVTFDRWNSTDMIKYLNAIGMKAEVLSVDNKQYITLASVIGEERLKAPNDDILRNELLQLKMMDNGKIDHPRVGGKDCADAVAGAVHNAIEFTRRGANNKIEVLTLDDLRRAEIAEESSSVYDPASGVIRDPYAPKHAVEAPQDELADFLRDLRLI